MTSTPDMTASIEPRSDQLNAEDLLTGPRTVTITDVKRGTDEQPVNIVTAEFGPGRPYKPSKTMRRVIVAAWGADASVYIGRRLTIYRDPEITFGRDKVGGIRISALSDIPSRLSLALTVTRGRRAPFVVDPLPADSDVITPEQHKRLYELLVECGLGDKGAALEWIGHVVGHDIPEIKKLTGEQAAKAINKAVEILESAGQQPDEESSEIVTTEPTE